MPKRLRFLLCLPALMLLAPGCSSETGEDTTAAEMDSYGAGVTLEASTSIEEVLARSAELEGQTVRVEGTITEVCPMAGCWMDLADGESSIRIKVTDGEIVFPKDGAGRHAVAEGVVEKLEFDLDEARSYQAHMAEERGETFDPASVTEGMTIWRIKGSGARIEKAGA